MKLLAVTPGHRLHRERVMDLFWPELDREAAGANLRKAVHFARKSLGEPELIEAGNEVVALPAEVAVDAEQFEAAAKSALRAPEPKACEKAAELYGGELLPDDRYVEWLDEPRKALQQRYARVLRAGKLWERMIALDPADEEAQCALMQAALDAGNRGEAIRLFKHLRERLRVDLGLGPSKAAVALYDRALEAPAVRPVDVTDRLRASLAWGLIHLHSGELAKAEQIARETRGLALGAGLAREMGEATALLGMVAHMQGRWRDLFRSEFIEWVRKEPAFVSNIFDGHLCLAEFCIASKEGHEQMGAAAHELLAVAERAGSIAGRGLATLILGEASLFSGRLDDAERLLAGAGQLHDEVGGAAGQVMVIERVAQLALARGQKSQAGRLVEKGSAVAKTSWLAPHLVIRIHALAVEAASSPEQALDAILEGDRALAGACQPCTIGYRAAAAIALAEMGEVDQVSRRLDEAEHLAGMWNGGPWVAAIWEARGVFRRAQGNADRAAALFAEAAARYAELGRPLDQARCAARMA